MGSQGASPSIFRIANHTLVRCEDGSLEVEATLFPATVGARVNTSAGEARARLARSGLTAAFAVQALAAIDPAVLASYARADCLRAVLSKLGPCEVLAGRTFHHGAQAYDGAWFDLRALVADLRLQNAGLLVQGLYLVSVLDELAPATPISLENGGDGKVARIAFLKPASLIGALGKLAPRPPRSRRDEDEPVRRELTRSLRDRATVATLRARARHLALEQALADIDRPTRGRLADTELWTIERQLEAADIRGALERIQSYVRSHGEETAATRYLRAHLALVEGSEPARRIAESLIEDGPPFYELELLKARAWMSAGVWSYAHHFARALVDDPNVSDAVSLAALEVVDAVAAKIGRGTPVPPAAWDEGPPSTERLMHQVSSQTLTAPASKRPEEEPKIGSVLASPIYMVVANPVEPIAADASPSSLNLPMEFEEPVSEAPISEEAPPTQVEIEQVVDLEHLELEEPTLFYEPGPRADAIDLPPVEHFPVNRVEHVRVEHARYPPVEQVQQPYVARVEPTSEQVHVAEVHTGEVHFAEAVFEPPGSPRAQRVPLERGHVTDLPPPMQSRALAVRPQHIHVRYVPEEVESLPLPPGLDDRQLLEGIAAKNGDEVRIVSTRFARMVGREYRQKYGVQLRTDATAVEWMQRHLLTRWGSSGVSGPEASWDIRRHGALLSEILARSLGAAWVDVSPTEIGYWAMFVPPRTRTWPFGRVHRFLSLGHREKDLVSYYLDLVARSRDS